MQLTVDIIDSLDDTLILREEKAVGGSMILNWKGGDLKDDIYILGSSFDFEMLGMSCADGQYSDLFTGNETRYRVKVYTPEVTLWQGFILPDAYSEPYTDGPIPVKFRATDGLGRLKGKYLPDDFYEEEKSVIKIIAKCLELTGVGLEFRFAPAIENSLQKDYDKIYIDTALFKSGEKKDDAHAILDSLLKSMLCSLFQADNYYNIEGFNIRNFRVYQTKVYSVSGELVEEQEVTRLRKDLTATKPTTVTIQPPYGTIRVTHKREPLALPETVATEKNDGWVQMENVNEPIYATDWFANDGTEANTGEDMTVGIDREINGTGYVSLKKKISVKKGQKLRLKMGFELVVDPIYGIEDESVIFAREQGHWINPFPMSVRLFYESNGELPSVPSILLRNYFPDADNSLGRFFELDFDDDGKVEKEVQFIPNRSGELDIWIHLPIHTDTYRTFIDRVNITELKLEEIGFKEEYISEISLEGYTNKKELELDFADDVSGFSKSFRLQQLKTLGEFNTKEIPVSVLFQKDGFWWAYVDLMGANLIKDNIKTIESSTGPVEVLDVIYNYNNSQEHAVKLTESLPETIDPETSEVTYFFTVKIHDFNAIIENRDYWEQWTDSKYKIEKKRYCDVASSILDLMSRSPLVKLDYRVLGNAKINDFLNFDFQGGKQFMMTSCKWDLDKGLTNITTLQAFYGVEAGQNLPPVVEAGEDLYIDSERAGLSAAAYDPDGFIVSYEWEEITNNGATFSTNRRNNTITVANLTEDYYEFRVTVTDNDGATASDTVRIYKYRTVNIDAVLTTFDSPHELNEYREYTLSIHPEIPEGSALNIQGALSGEGVGDVQTTVKVIQNGLEKRRLFGRTEGELQEYSNKGFSLNYMPGDEIIISINLSISRDDISEVTGGFDIEMAEFVDGYGQVLGIPISKTHSLKLL